MKQHHSSNEHLLILDSGDFIGGRGKKERLKGEFLFKAFSQLEYDVINLGERDFLQGYQFLEDMKNKYDLPLVSVNIFQPDGKELVFPAYMIEELKGFQHGDTRFAQQATPVLDNSPGDLDRRWQNDLVEVEDPVGRFPNDQKRHQRDRRHDDRSYCSFSRKHRTES